MPDKVYSTKELIKAAEETRFGNDRECLTCKSTTFTSHGCRTTLLAYDTYTENGVFHDHNPNRIKRLFRCVNNHWWEAIIQNTCKNCDWTTKW